VRSLEGLVVIIVGTSPNIGAGLALGIARTGAAVVCVDARASHAQACASEVRASGGDASSAAADATDETAVQRCVDEAIRRHGHVDGLVNGAAFYDERGLLEMPIDAWRRQLDVIVTSAFLFTKHVATAMIDAGTGGSIVNLASTAAHQGQSGNVAYSSAKAAVLGLTRAAAMDLAPYRIRVNSLTPTSTDIGEARQRSEAWGEPTHRWEPTPRAARRRRLLPLGQMPTPTDYAAAATFLLSPDARFVTGTDLRVDAGALAKYWGTVDDNEIAGEVEG
jgi:NAD(P)-dependent dehydrogenase (short-subunit alcohol dehydrogenase family)